MEKKNTRTYLFMLTNSNNVKYHITDMMYYKIQIYILLKHVFVAGMTQ